MHHQIGLSQKEWFCQVSVCVTSLHNIITSFTPTNGYVHTFHIKKQQKILFVENNSIVGSCIEIDEGLNASKQVSK